MYWRGGGTERHLTERSKKDKGGGRWRTLGNRVVSLWLFISSRFFTSIFPFLESNWKFKLATMFWTKRRGAGIWPKGPKDKRRRTMTNARQSCRVALFAGYAPDCYPSACSRGGGDTHKATRRIERIYIFFSFHLACHFVSRVTRVECRLKRCNGVAQWTLYWKRRDILSAWKMEN